MVTQPVHEWQSTDVLDEVRQMHFGVETPMSGLDAIFRPRAIAIIGATDRDGAVGKTVLQNLIASRASCLATPKKFDIFPVNPTRNICCEMPCFPDIKSCPSRVDLAVIVTPANTVRSLIVACGAANVAAVIIISAGFKEAGLEGTALENEIVALARKHCIRLIGPNCLGIMSPHWGVNATFAASDALAGSVAFISQSGAMCTAVLDWSLKEGVGFSAFVSVGSMADVHWGDLIDYFGNDRRTQCILIYMETIGNVSHFLSAAQSVTMQKPIIVIKAGQSEAASKAAASHTGSLAGSHDAFLAAMRRARVMVVDTISELFDCALILGNQKRPHGGNLLIITNAGGPGVLATDAAIQSGASLCSLTPPTIQTLNSFLPTAWSHSNPIDILGDAGADLYARALEVALNDKNADGVLIILSPQAVTDCTGTARKVIEACKSWRAKSHVTKTILCSWMGGNRVSEGFNYLNRNGIPTFTHPDSAARAFGKIWSHTKSSREMYQMTDIEIDPFGPPDRKEIAIGIVNSAKAQGRDLLTEAESKQILKLFDVPVAETVVCSTVEAAMQTGKEMGFPCVVKLNSKTITHKSDVGGVKLNIKSAEQIRESWESIKANVDAIGPHHFQGVTVQPMLRLEDGIELILGSFVDNQFGPLILFGTGGCMVEIFKDSCLSVPPLNPTLAQIQIESTKVYTALKGGQGQRFPSVDLVAINKALCRFSHLICEMIDYISECDINPLLALPNRLIALDARIVLRTTSNQPKLAVRPYPSQYYFQNVYQNKTIEIRPTHYNDIKRLVKFFDHIMRDSFNCIEDIPSNEKGLLDYIVTAAISDYSRNLSLVAIEHKVSNILGLIQISKRPNQNDISELKIFLNGEGQQHLGILLLNEAIEVAKKEDVKTLQLLTSDNNVSLLQLLQIFNFTLTPSASHPHTIECFLIINHSNVKSVSKI